MQATQREGIEGARALVQAHRLHEAAAAYSRLASRSHTARVWWEYGATLAALEDFRAATGAQRRALACDPRFARAWNDLGVALVALGSHDEAAEAFERARADAACRSAASGNLGNLALTAGDSERAEQLYRDALRDDRSNLQARIALARLLFREGQQAEADLHIERARKRAPYDFDALLAQVTFRLSAGALEGAIAACEQFLTYAPFDSGALGLRAELERERGATEAAGLLQAGDWVRVHDLDVAPHLLAGLSAGVSSHRTLCHAPPHHATRAGWHSGALSGDENEAFAQLEPSFESALRDYAPPAEARRWWSDSRPRSVALHSWAVSLGGQGFQVPHLHPRGWLSGVFYVAVPEHVQQGDDDSHRGYLELGRPDPELGLRAPRTSLFVQPRPGRLVLFPSWLYHSTIPHGGAGDRLSIAFDCVRIR